MLYSGVACITDLMVKEGLINLDFADVRAIMRGMGKAMMGTGEASGEKRANRAAEAAIANPLLDDVSMKGARGLLISITGGSDLTLYELDEAATRIREEVDQDANIILGATFDESLDGIIRVSVVATGIEPALISANSPNNPAIAETEHRIAEVAERLRAEARARAASPVPSIRTDTVSSALMPAAQPPRSRPPGPASVAPAPAPMMEPRQEPATVTTRDDVLLAPCSPGGRPVRAGARRAAARAGAAAPCRPVRAAAPGRPGRRAGRRPRPADAADPRAAADRPDPADGDPGAGRGIRPESKRTSLLRRLATVGFGGRREDEAPAPARWRPGSPGRYQPPAPAAYQPRLPPPTSRRCPGAAGPRAAGSPVPAGPGLLDGQGRSVPQPPRMMDDDQLEIPAFLRRQAN